MLLKILFRFQVNVVKSVKINSYINRNSIYVRSSTGLMLRNGSNNRKELDRKVPTLFKLESKGIENILYSPFIINYYFKPFFDKNFDLNNFLNLAKQHLCTISAHLADNNIEGIRYIVTKEAFEEITENYSKYSSEQKRNLKVKFEDIVVCMPFNVKIDRQSPDLSIVKIIVIFDHLPNSKDIEIDSQSEEITKDPKKFSDASLKLIETMINEKSLCIYQFRREYKTGVESDWIVSKVFHVKNKDVWTKSGLLDDITGLMDLNKK